MKTKSVILFLVFFATTGIAKECKQFIDMEFHPYTIVRKQFIRDKKCIIQSDSIIINKKTKARTELLGFVLGIRKFSLSNSDMLRIDTLAGAHTHVVYFFKVKDNEDLDPIKGGEIGSDTLEPAIYLDVLNDTLIVSTRYGKGDKNCRYLMENVYQYKNNEFQEVSTDNLLLKECH